MESDIVCMVLFFFFKQKTAYEMRISDWSSDVCSSDLPAARQNKSLQCRRVRNSSVVGNGGYLPTGLLRKLCNDDSSAVLQNPVLPGNRRSEEHTSELQSLMRISYAVFCLKKKKQRIISHIHKV